MRTTFFAILALAISLPSFANLETETAKKLKLFEYDKSFAVKSMKRTYILNRYNKHKVTLEGKGPSGKVLKTEFVLYKSKVGGDTKKPLILIAPPILDPTPLDYIIASIFAKKGYHVAVVKTGEDIANKNRPIKDIPYAFIRGITRFRRVIDWAETQNYIDSKNIGSYGMSLGGVINAFLIGVEDRVKASLIMVGGGNLPEIFAASEQSVVKNYRDARMKENNLKSVKEFKSFSEKLLFIDPLDFSHRVNKERVYMIISEKDEAVKTESQMALWESFGKPKFKSFDANHFGSIWKSRKHHGPIFRFFKKRLKTNSPTEVSND